MLTILLFSSRHAVSTKKDAWVKRYGTVSRASHLGSALFGFEMPEIVNMLLSVAQLISTTAYHSMNLLNCATCSSFVAPTTPSRGGGWQPTVKTSISACYMQSYNNKKRQLAMRNVRKGNNRTLGPGPFDGVAVETDAGFTSIKYDASCINKPDAKDCLLVRWESSL